MTRDRLGRRRLDPAVYGRQGGGIERVIVYRCANPTCGTYWPVRTRARRFDSKCRLCDHRNTIRWDSRQRRWGDRRGRPRKVSWRLYDTWALARADASRMNTKRVARRNTAVGSTQGFITAREYQQRLDAWRTRHDLE